jgi:acetyl-CoA C-acetyltransferase
MEEVFVLDGLRTPFGSLGGALANIPAPHLAAEVIKGLLTNTKVKPDEIDEVIFGQVLSGGSGQAPARQAMRLAGLPDHVHAMTVNKVCGSGLMAIMLAAQAIKCGLSSCVIAGGMENMSLAPYALTKARYGARLGHQQALDLLLLDGLLDPYSGRHMGELADDLTAEYGITRQDQDSFAIHSYKRAQMAVRAGAFAEEIVPITKSSRNGEEVVMDDEEPFRVQFNKIESLKPVFSKEGTITAANASSINDGAALVLLAGAEKVRTLGVQPLARLAGVATHSIQPARFAEAPVGAIQKACSNAGISLSEIGLFEINEAFALVPLIAARKLDLDPDRINVNGGAVAIGHPLGASGGRLVTTLIREMKRRNERYGLATLCIGGGEGVAAVFELA